MSQKIKDWEGERVPKINEIWMLERNQNSFKNRWFSMSKSRKIVKTNASRNIVFFACVFDSILGGFGAGFGRVLGGGWGLLAPLGLYFLVFFWGAKFKNAV